MEGLHINRYVVYTHLWTYNIICLSPGPRCFLHRLGNCDLCATNLAKYRCPRCNVVTCSLGCSRSHKKLKNYCDGLRDRTTFVPLDKFDSLDLLSGNYRSKACTLIVYVHFFFYPRHLTFGIGITVQQRSSSFHWLIRYKTATSKKGTLFTCLLGRSLQFQQSEKLAILPPHCISCSGHKKLVKWQ